MLGIIRVLWYGWWCLLMPYCAVAFINMDSDAASWGSGPRFGAVVGMSICFIICGIHDSDTKITRNLYRDFMQRFHQ